MPSGGAPTLMPLIDVTQSMLLVIDAQQDFYGAGRADVDRAALDGMLRRAAWVTAVAGRLGVPVVVTEEDSTVNGATAEMILAVLQKGAVVLPELGNRVVAVHDALFSPGAAHANGLGRMQRAGVELVSAKELAYDWLRTLTRARNSFRTNPDIADPPGSSL
jgi:nicotinamidase-related amidase